VSSALEPFRSLSSHVRVIYVPMTKDQGASDVIEELVTIGVALRHVKRELGESSPPAGPKLAAAAEAEGRTQASAALSGISPRPETDGSVSIDAGLVGGLLALATDAAEQAGATFFLNESWVTLDDVVQMPFPGVSRGLVVAAVGNDPGRDVARTPIISFAGLASVQQQIVAVMTLGPSGGLDCDSSIVPYAHPNLGAVGFSGRLPNGTCGSSFAAPRVAWVLAARETLSAATVSDGQAWVQSLRERLKSLRKPGAMPAGLLLDPSQYIAAP
jgi:hypothetical protein